MQRYLGDEADKVGWDENRWALNPLLENLDFLVRGGKVG